MTQPVFTCSKLTIETLEQRCEICPELTIKGLASNIKGINQLLSPLKLKGE